MTDKELLELAARAAGIDVEAGCKRNKDALENWWNPLTDDGDALRLAVKLNLHVKIDFDTDKNEVRCFQMEVECAEKGDPYAATRRAIVCAAAEIPKKRDKRHNDPKSRAARGPTTYGPME